MKFLFFLFIFLFSLASFAESQWEPQTQGLKKIYHSIQKQKKLSSEAILNAFLFFETHQKKWNLKSDYIAIADFTLDSLKKRLAIIDLKTGNIGFYKVSHGKGSDKNHDTIVDLVSDDVGSNATPPGFHKMGETYIGQHGLSLKMHGLEPINKNSLKRYIVLHGAKYVSWKHPGRSQGCPAVEERYVNEIINKLKKGSLFYHYWKNKKS